MEIISISVSDLLTDPNNARKHDNKNLDAIKGSLSKFGQQKPIVVDKKNIILAGNGTYAAAKDLNWETIDCVVTDLDGFNASAYALADNRSAEPAEWDKDILQETLKALEDEGFGIDDIGFGDFDFGLEESKDVFDDPDVAFTAEIDPKDSYMILLFKDAEAFTKACEKHQIPKCKVNNSSSQHPSFLKYGITRLIKYEDFQETFTNE